MAVDSRPPPGHAETGDHGPRTQTRRRVQRPVPYFAQWESRELVADIIAHRRRAEDDPRWPASGAESAAEYALWSWNACGMACLKMVLAARGQQVPLVTLARACERYGGYVRSGTQIGGLIYAPFLRFVSAEFGLAGRLLAPMQLDDIIASLAASDLLIASVHPAIRHAAEAPGRGGHLVLVTGYDLDTSTLTFQNPSGTTPSSQENAQLDFPTFERFFAHRGMALHL
jgi:hypothetical protein